jgi:hypothetical protein
MDDVVMALHRAGSEAFAGQLDIKGMVQAISSALRHAKDRGLVSAGYPGRHGGCLWSLTVRGSMRVDELDPRHEPKGPT